VCFFTVPDARAILGQGAVEAGAGGNPAATLLAEELGGGKGTTGVISSCPPSSAVAFATILAVVAGLVIASGAMAHDLWTSVVRKGQASASPGSLSWGWGRLRSAPPFSVGRAYSDRPRVRRGRQHQPSGPALRALLALTKPAIVSVPAGFLFCWLGPVLGRERGEVRSFHELHDLAETGVGSEGSQTTDSSLDSRREHRPEC